MPVLPTLDKMPRGEMDPSMFSHRDPVVDALGKTGMDKGPVRANGIVRPSSTLIMQIGQKDTKKMIKKKFDLPNARARDPFVPLSHSYKSKQIQPGATLNKTKDPQYQSSTTTGKGPSIIKP